MSILLNSDIRVICQGMTGRQGSFHMERAISSGTNVVAGVRMGKGGTQHLGLPVFDTVSEAVSTVGANASVIFVPPASAADAILESIRAQIELIVCVTERIPVLDMVKIQPEIKESKTATCASLEPN